MSHDHEHDHHDHDHGGAVEGSWRDQKDDRPLSVARRRFLTGVGIAAGAAAAGPLAAEAAADDSAARRRPTNPWDPRGQWLAGDHHIHTQYSSDGQYEVATQVAKARQHGLDWVVITDHGGVAHQKFSIDQTAPDVERARRANRDVLVYQGVEWNIPGAEHATVFLPPGRDAVDVLRAFEAAYDGGVLSTPVDQGGRGLLDRPTSAAGEPYALAALRYLEAQVLAGRTELALMLANHPSRRGVDSPHEMRGWRDAAPGVAVGMEGAPGHQAAGIPVAAGGRGGARGYYDSSPGVDSFPGYAPTAEENPYRTHGGFDWAAAKVGGLWDSLLAEGRPWWITATSDSHQVFRDTFVQGGQDHATTGSRGAPVDTGVPRTGFGDFWPGYYSSTVVGASSRSYVDVMRGLQAGRIIAVHGRLVDAVDVRVRALSDGDRRGVTTGGRTWVRRGGDVEVTIEVTLASGPNHNGTVPKLAKVDLVAGPITGPSADRDALSAPGTSVVRTFEVARGARKATFSHTFRAVDRAFYLRLRGSDGNRLTADGGPVVDVAGDADPWSDLWFYANPVFVDVV
jgi:hypothetical protein